MLRLLDESYKPGLSHPEAHEVTRLTALGRSFVAFQIQVMVPERSLLLVANAQDAVMGECLPTLRLRVKASHHAFELFQVRQVNGVGDPLLETRSVVLRPDEPVVFLAMSDTGAHPQDDIVRIKLLAEDGRDVQILAGHELPIVSQGFALPPPAEYVKKIDLWQHNSCIARYYGVQTYSDAHFAILTSYVEALAQLGQKSVTIIAAHTPWDGQKRSGVDKEHAADLFEYQMPLVEKTATGLRFDFSVIDRYIALCEAYGIADEYEVFGLCGAWTDRTLVLAQWDDGYVFLDEDEVDLYISALYRHFEHKGYLAKTLVCADEPKDQERFSQEIARIRRLAPDFRFKAALDNPAFADAFGSDLAHVVPSFFTACWRLDELRAIKAAKTWYICCGPNKPNTFLTSPLVEARALAYLNEIFGFDGLLRWAFTAWSRAPYADARVGPWEAGDSYLIYPGQDGRPVYSLRFLALRRAMEDLQLLSLVANSADYTARIWHQMDPRQIYIKDWMVSGDLYALSYQDYEAVRAAMVKELSGSC